MHMQTFGLQAGKLKPSSGCTTCIQVLHSVTHAASINSQYKTQASLYGHHPWPGMVTI